MDERNRLEAARNAIDADPERPGVQQGYEVRDSRAYGRRHAWDMALLGFLAGAVFTVLALGLLRGAGIVP